ncbi:MAG: enoyl-CoA hydratase/isomerase family protein [Chloroflexi bacterium]|nr:enoyl-CoA hydratase/isomerase family protein [Chloroflexota bacterium]
MTRAGKLGEMDECKEIIYHKDRAQRVARITLNRPEKLNAITHAMKNAFLTAIHDAESDDAIKVVIIQGAGRAFCSGIDLGVAFTDPETWGVQAPHPGEKARRPSLRRMLTWDRWQCLEFISSIGRCNKATIARVQGYALALGFDIAMQCDLVIASEEAVVGNAQTRAMGGFYDGTVYARYLRLGNGFTKEHCFAPRLYDAQEGMRRGFVNRVVPLDRLDEEVDKCARGICEMPADGITIGKNMQIALLDIMGYRKGLNAGYMHHVVHGNMRWDPGEYIYFRERSKKGARTFFVARDERTRGAWDNDARFTKVKTREQRAGEPEKANGNSSRQGT